MLHDRKYRPHDRKYKWTELGIGLVSVLRLAPGC
jgi:hypothetical protein